MPKDLKECNRIDVLSLTGDLRESESWAVLREAIELKGVDLSSAALCQYCEGDDGFEYGLLVFKNYVIQFEKADSNTLEFSSWNEFVDPIGMYSDYRSEVEWTREMLENNEV